jgi:hypothetical protein
VLAGLGASRTGASTLAIGNQAVVQVWARGGSEINIRTWDRPSVQIDTDDEEVQVVRRTIAFGTGRNPLSVSIPVTTIRVREANGGLGTATLPPEDFPYASDMRSGSHDVVRVTAGPDTHTTVTVPAGVSIVDVRILGAGNLSVTNYRGGTIFAMNGGGQTLFENVQAAAFVQALNGRFIATDSSFDRIRARGNTVSMLFERCRSKQIEVSTYSGPIVYDNGTFDPGLARFTSTSGPIAVGVASGAQVTARSQDGRVFALWERRPPVEQRGGNEATAVIAGGGALVNAITTRGNVFIYDGSLAARRAVPFEWRRIHAALLNRVPNARPGIPARRAPRPLS